MHIITAIRGALFCRFADALQASVRESNPAAEFKIVHYEQPDAREGVPAHVFENLAKVDRWWMQLCQLADGEEVLFVDGDTLILRDVSQIMPSAHVFGLHGHLPDFAVTVRPGRWRLNAGVVACVVGEESRTLMRTWLDVHDQMLQSDDATIQRIVRQYGGLSQAALAESLADLHITQPDCTVGTLPCHTWNLCSPLWAQYRNRDCVTRIVHINGQLRRWCLDESSNPAQNEDFADLIRIWRRYAAV